MTLPVQPTKMHLQNMSFEASRDEAGTSDAHSCAGRNNQINSLAGVPTSKPAGELQLVLGTK